MLSLDDRLRFALAEDVGRGDATTNATIRADAYGRAVVKLKAQGVLCGLDVAERVFTLVDPSLLVKWHAPEGEWLEGQVIGEVRGGMRSILIAERLALNLLQRLSGIATLTRRHVKAVEGSATRVLDTRKTTPLWRDLEKRAVRVGGGVNHRFGLDDGILIKDNHVAAAGGVRAAVRAARDSSYLLQIECEVTTLEELHEALSEGVHRVLLDNMNDDTLREAVRLRDETAPNVTLEASGNMTLERLPRVAATGVDFVSVGALTHSAASLDISLDVELYTPTLT